MANTLVSYARYLGKMIWPVRLACFYPAPHEWPLLWVLGAALLLTALTALCVWQAKRAPYLAVGWFWYLGTLVPVIGIVQVGLQSMADRYTYLPLIGLFIAGVWAAADWGSRQSRRKAEIGSQKMFDVRAPESGKDAFHRVPDYARNKWDAVERVPAWLMGAALVALLLCGYLTWSQTRYWRTTASLFAHALAVTRDNEVAQNNLGTCLFKAGNVAAAEPHFVEALRIRPNLQDALVGLALCRYTEGRVPEAIDCLQRALDMAPTPAGHFNLANVLRDQGRLPEAEAHYQAALRLRPYFVEAWVNLGVVKAEQGDAEAAARAYATALQFRPDCAIAHLYLGQLLMVQHKWDEAIAHLRTGLRAAIPANAHDAPGRKGQTDEAIRQDREALRLKSDYAKARNNLGFALDRKGQTDEAISQYQEAIRLKPDYANARDNLGLALGRKGQTDEAIRQFQEALRLRPEDASAHNNLGTALAKKGQFDEAIRHFQEAVRLKPDYALAHQNLARALRMKNAPASP
jgi:tetratricopeptide (TPR) repeat protein